MSIESPKPSPKTEFLSMLFGTLATEDAAIQLYAYEQGGHWPKVRRFTDIEAATEYADTNEDKNIFFNCALIAKSGSRGSSKDARVLPALFADIDTADGEHGGERADKAEVLEMLQDGFSLPPPSILVDSGGGFHAYWLLDTPLTDMKLASDLLLGLNDRLKAWHDSMGYKYERLKDLARVLRVPGTFNYKTDPAKQVELIWPKGSAPKKYTAKELTFGQVTKAADTKVTTDFDEIDDDRAYKRAINRCLKVEPEWNEDASGFVLRCCRQCVRSGCSADLTVAVVIVVRAVRHFPGDWTPDKIKLRCNSILQLTDLGSATDEPYENTQ